MWTADPRRWFGTVGAQVYADAVGEAEIELQDRYADLVEEFAGVSGVDPPSGGPGVGRSGLGSHNKISVMLVRGRLVPKLPEPRADDRAAGGGGLPCDANKATP